MQYNFLNSVYYFHLIYELLNLLFHAHFTFFRNIFLYINFIMLQNLSFSLKFILFQNYFLLIRFYFKIYYLSHNFSLVITFFYLERITSDDSTCRHRVKLLKLSDILFVFRVKIPSIDLKGEILVQISYANNCIYLFYL